jgi:hypothetical protein
MTYIPASLKLKLGLVEFAVLPEEKLQSNDPQFSGLE